MALSRPDISVSESGRRPAKKIEAFAKELVAPHLRQTSKQQDSATTGERYAESAADAARTQPRTAHRTTRRKRRRTDRVFEDEQDGSGDCGGVGNRGQDGRQLVPAERSKHIRDVNIGRACRLRTRAFQHCRRQASRSQERTRIGHRGGRKRHPRLHQAHDTSVSPHAGKGQHSEAQSSARAYRRQG